MPTDLELAVLKALTSRYGKARAITRELLVFEVDLWVDGIAVKDRAVREAIENLRQTHPIGARIMSSSGWQGYWLAESFEEFEALYQEQRNRALNIMAGLRKQRDLLRREWYETVDQEPQMPLNL